MNDARLRRCFLRFRDRGDREALGKVFDGTAHQLLGIALHLVQRMEDAEDLLQATFVTAIECADRFDGERPLFPWLAGILAQHSRNRSRKEGRTETLEVDVAGEERLFQEMHSGEQREALDRAIQRLPQPYREVLLLRLQGLSSGAIAERLSRAPGTVRMQCLRGLELLRKSAPLGLVSGATLALVSGRGIAAIRAEVLGHVAVGASISPAMALIGLIMTKKIVALVTVTLVVAGAWYVASDTGSRFSKQSSDLIGSVAIDGESVSASPQSSTDTEVDVSRSDEVADARLPSEPSTAKTLADGEVWVRGRVVDRQTHLPVPGAAVWVGADRTFEAFPPRAEAVRTTAEGTFQMAVNLQWAWNIEVWSGDYAFLQQRVPRLAEVVALESGIDAGTLELDRGIAVRGRVRTEAGMPVARAALLLRERIPMDEFIPAASLPVGRSAEDGSFQVQHVPLGYAESAWLFAFSETGSGAASFELHAGLDRITEVEIVLFPSASLEVTIEDNAGGQVSDAIVVVLPRGPPFVELRNWRPYAYLRGIPEMTRHFMAETDANGRVCLDTLPAGFECSIGVRKEGFVTSFVETARLEHGRCTQIHVELVRESGFGLRGRVVDLRGSAIGGVEVERYGLYQSTWSKREEVATVAPDGSFEIQALPGGSHWDLVIAAEGIARRSFHVEIPKDRGLEDIVLTAEPAFPVQGIVRDEFFAPLAGVKVYLERPDGYPTWATKGETGRDGLFSIPNAIAEERLLHAGFPEIADWEPGCGEVHLEPGQKWVEVIARRSVPGIAEVLLEIEDAHTGSPLLADHAQYQVRNPESNASYYSAFEEISIGLAKATRVRSGLGEYSVVLAGYPRISGKFEVRPGDTEVRVAVKVPPFAKVHGRIDLHGLPRPVKLSVFTNRDAVAVDRDGQPIPKVTKRVSRVDRGEEFWFVDVDPGEVPFRLMADGLIARKTVTIEAGSDCEVVLQALAAGNFRTSGASGLPPGYAVLRVSGPGDAAEDIRLGGPPNPLHDIRWQWPAGTVRYELRWARGDTPPPTDEDWDILQEGTFDVRAMEETTLPIDGH